MAPPKSTASWEAASSAAPLGSRLAARRWCLPRAPRPGISRRSSRSWGPRWRRPPAAAGAALPWLRWTSYSVLLGGVGVWVRGSFFFSSVGGGGWRGDVWSCGSVVFWRKVPKTLGFARDTERKSHLGLGWVYRTWSSPGWTPPQKKCGSNKGRPIACAGQSCVKWAFCWFRYPFPLFKAKAKTLLGVL